MGHLRKISVFLFVFQVIFLTAQTPFVCDGRFFATTENHLSEIIIDWESDTFRLLPFENELPRQIDAIGYNPTDNFIYGLSKIGKKNIFYQIDATGKAFPIDTLEFDLNLWNPLIKGGAFTKTGEYIFSLKSETAIDAPNGIVILDPQNPSDFSVNEATILGVNPLIFIEDFSEDPVNELMWAVQHYLEFEDNPDSSFLQNFNAHNCFSAIDPFAATVDNASFEALPNYIFSHGHITTMFHNSFNELFGQRLTEVYQFDVDKNTVKKIKIDRVEHTYDGCSCPYTLKMRQTVSPEITYPCTEVIYTFTVANFTQNDQTNVIFKDTFPVDFEILEVTQNPFGGSVSGLNSNELTISNMDIPRGIDSIKVRVLLPEITTGIFENQAWLKNINLTGTNDLRTEIASDYPPSFERDDPTPLEIIPFEVEVKGENLVICRDSSAALQPLELLDNLNIIWSTGSTDSLLTIFEPGVYGVTVSAGCNADSAEFEVIQSPFKIDLESEYVVSSGDSILIEAEITALFPTNTIFWNSFEPNIISCPNYPKSYVKPNFDGWLEINAKNEIGCSASDRALLKVRKTVYAPNIFSPNFDGVNDYFYLQTKNDLPVKNFQIFDRWGNLVFERKTGMTNVLTKGWNGIFNGKPATTGVYFWKAKVLFAHGEEIDFSGNLSLIR